MDYYNCLGYFKEEEDYEMLLLEKLKNDQICQEEGCNILSNFNYKGEKRPIYCVKHKEVYMINVTYNICKKEDCEILANFNYEGEKIASYCLKHNNEDLYSVINRCQEEDYEKIPIKPDPVIKRCKEEYYEKIPVFNIKRQKYKIKPTCDRAYCPKHKKL